MDSTKRDNKEVQEKLMALQKEKDQVKPPRENFDLSLIEYSFCSRTSRLFSQEPKKVQFRTFAVRIFQKLHGRPSSLIDSLLFVLKLTAEFKEKRRLVDELKDDLQSKIADYSQMAESGSILNATIVSFFLNNYMTELVWTTISCARTLAKSWEYRVFIDRFRRKNLTGSSLCFWFIILHCKTARFNFFPCQKVIGWFSNRAGTSNDDDRASGTVWILF